MGDVPGNYAYPNRFLSILISSVELVSYMLPYTTCLCPSLIQYCGLFLRVVSLRRVTIRDALSVEES